MADIEQPKSSKPSSIDIKEKTLGQSQSQQSDFMDTTVEVTEEEREIALALKNYVPDTEAEKKLVRKVDLIMIPTVWWMYILAVLDRSNIVSLELLP